MKVVFHIIMGTFFSFVVATLLAYNNVNLLMGDADDVKKVSIYFKTSTLESEVNSFIENNISENAESNTQITNYNKVTKEQSLEEFKKTFGDFSQNLLELESINDLVPFSLEITFKNEIEKMKFVNRISNNELIDEIVYVDQIFNRYKTLQRALNGFLVIFFSVSFLLTALLTSLLIKNIVYKDQRQIEIFALFGASYKDITLSYFKKLTTFFVLTAGFAISLTYLAFFLIKIKFMAVAELAFLAERMAFLDFYQMLALVLGFALSYYLGLFFVLRSSIQGTFNR